MDSLKTTLESHFPLNNIAAALEKFQPPASDFSPEAAWESTYSVCTLSGICDRVGQLTLCRRPAADKDYVDLQIDYRKFFSGGFQHHVEGTVRCRKDVLATPISWAYRSATEDATGKVLPNTLLKKRGQFEKDLLVILDKTGERRMPCAEPCAVNWALFDVVQRAATHSFEPVPFTLLEHFDAPKVRQHISYRESFTVPLGGKRVLKHRWRDLEKGRVRDPYWEREGGVEVQLHAYDQVGEGIVPWVYYKNDAGRLLFAVSGLEAYILESGEVRS